MSTDKRQIAYVKKYQGKLYRVPVYIPKDLKGTLEDIAHQKSFKSLNAYIKYLIEQDSGLKLS